MNNFFIRHFGWLILAAAPLYSQAIIADHQCTDIYSIPASAIQQAKNTLHIGYGFTSHGSQIVDGMTGLVGFMNSRGYENNLFDFNQSGAGGALHLYEGDGYGDGDLDHDAGYYPDWVNETRDFLGTPDNSGMGSSHPDINVIMWAWCGQLSWYSSDDVDNYYLNEMNQLESDYSGVTFVYMTGHSDGSGLEGSLHQNNQHIRDYCQNSGKVLYDYYDIECYDPDGNYYGDRHVSDDCSYDGGNWATAWQNSHTEGTDWFSCGSAHSEPLNANQKAYAAWWLWARLAGWDGGQTPVSETAEQPVEIMLHENYPNPFNPSTRITYTLPQVTDVSLQIYDARGRLVTTLAGGVQTAGRHEMLWQPDRLSSGLYLLRLQADGQVQTHKMLLSR